MSKFALGRQRFLEIKEWNGRKTVDIRNWIDDKTPTREGINLPLIRWQSLCDNRETISDALQQVKNGEKVDFQLHIGNKDFVCVNSDYPCINIRQFWFPPDKTTLQASKKGITLYPREWETLKELVPKVQEEIPELQTIIPCYQTHENQEGMWTCSECCGHQPGYLNELM